MVENSDIDAHTTSLEKQPWWEFYMAEQALPPCPVCNEQLELLITGDGWCDVCNTEILI